MKTNAKKNNKNDKNKWEKYRSQLINERQKIIGELSSDKNMYTSLDTYKEGDLADRAYSSYEMGFLAKLSSTQREMLEQINKALEKIDSDKYGLCEVCNAKIKAPRLKAIPWTPYCITHADYVPEEQ